MEKEEYVRKKNNPSISKKWNQKKRDLRESGPLEEFKHATWDSSIGESFFLFNRTFLFVMLIAV